MRRGGEPRRLRARRRTNRSAKAAAPKKEKTRLLLLQGRRHQGAGRPSAARTAISSSRARPIVPIRATRRCSAIPRSADQRRKCGRRISHQRHRLRRPRDNWWDVSFAIPGSAAVDTVEVKCGKKTFAELKVPLRQPDSLAMEPPTPSSAGMDDERLASPRVRAAAGPAPTIMSRRWRASAPPASRAMPTPETSTKRRAFRSTCCRSSR